MGEIRALVWVPLAVEVVRTAVHKAGVGKAVLVPVKSGTVIVPTESTRLADVATWVNRCRKAGAPGLGFLWDDTAMIAVPGAYATWEWGDAESVRALLKRGGQLTFLRRESRDNKSTLGDRARLIGEILGAPPHLLANHLLAWQIGGPAGVLRLLEAASRPEVAELLRQVDSGVFDEWRDSSSSPRARQRPYTWAVAIFMLLWLPLIFAGVPGSLRFPILVGLWLVVGTTWLLARRVIARQPVDQVLPVVRVVDGQPVSEVAGERAADQ